VDEVLANDLLWFTGWIYCSHGILTVTAVVGQRCAGDDPASCNGLGWHSLNAARPEPNLFIG